MKVKLTRNLGRNLADALGKEVGELLAGTEHDLPRADAEGLAKASLCELLEQPQPPKAPEPPAGVTAVPKAGSTPEAKDEPKQAAKSATKARSK